MTVRPRSAAAPRRDPDVRRVLIPRTRFGPVGVVWAVRAGGPKVVRVLLSRPGAPADRRLARLHPEARAGSCAAIRAVADTIVLLLEGADLAIPLDVADLAACAPFQRAVLRAEHAIPRGKVSTYALLAARVGRPGAARAAGTALAANPFPLVVPCHRAVRSDGSPGGYQGGPAMKRALLALEGVRFDDAGRVAVARFHYGRRAGACRPAARTRE
jgi:methylated-DNA-[protein]-cysteine S-methyltransferase